MLVINYDDDSNNANNIPMFHPEAQVRSRNLRAVLRPLGVYSMCICCIIRCVYII